MKEKITKLFNPERRELARKYHKKRDLYNKLGLIFKITILILFFLYGLEFKIYEFISWNGNRELSILLYILLLNVLFFLLVLPINYYLAYRLNREYRLSNQEPGMWVVDEIKSFVLNLIFSYLAVRIYLYLVANFPENWWIYFTIIGSLFFILITFILPVVLLPLFFKLKPYPDSPLKERIMAMVKKSGVKIDEVYEINLSSKVNFANAAVIGLGKTRKIILADNLKDKYTVEEIEAIMAHELGHQINRDIFRNLLIQPLFLLISSYIIYRIYPGIAAWRGYEGMSRIVSLPLLSVLWGMVYWFLNPLQLYFSRRAERKADEFSYKLTQNPQALASGLAKLADESLAKLKLNWYKLIFKASHPPIGDRVEKALNYDGLHNEVEE